MQWFQDYWWVLLLAVLLMPVIAVLLFMRWLRSQPAMVFDEKVRSWDVFVKLVSALTVVATGAILIGKYFDQREQASAREAVRSQQESSLRKAELLRQKLSFDTERYQRQQKLLTEAKRVAARLANSRPPAVADLTRFEELYYADLVGVEKRGGQVEKLMVMFRRGLNGEDAGSGQSLSGLALQLAAACETELADSERDLLNQQEAILALVVPAAPK
jgi:hypothetical protein